MRCDLCSRVVKNPHNAVRKTADKLCQTCLVITERIMFFGHFALVANVSEIRKTTTTYDKNHHWICTCGQHNHYSRGVCLRCGEYP